MIEAACPNMLFAAKTIQRSNNLSLTLEDTNQHVSNLKNFIDGFGQASMRHTPQPLTQMS